MIRASHITDSNVREAKQSEELRLLRQYVKQRDSDAFRRLAGRYLNFVYTICHRELRHPQAAEDATQETFIALAQQAGRLRPDTVLASWLFSVAVRKCRSSQRLEARRRRLPTRSAHTEPADPDSEAALHSALGQLAEKDRQAVVLRVMMEYSHAEVGRELGISEDAARMRTDRALKRIRESVGAATLSGWALIPAPFPVGSLRVPPVSTAPISAKAIIGVSLVGVVLVGVSVRTLIHSTAAGSNPSSTSAPSATTTPPLGRTEAPDENSSLLPFHARVTIREGGRTGFSGDTWRTAEVIRWRQEMGDHEVDAQIRNGVLRSIAGGAGDNPSVAAITVASPTWRVVEIDAFEAALLELPTYLHTKKPLARVAAPKDREATVSEGGRTYHVWRDPKHDNRIWKVDYKSGDFRFLTSAVKWQKVDGAWLPVELRSESWFQGKPSTTRDITLSNIQIGSKAPAPPEMPTPKYGSLVMDVSRSVIYRIDSKWKRVSAEQHVSDGDIGAGGEQLDAFVRAPTN